MTLVRTTHSLCHLYENDHPDLVAIFRALAFFEIRLVASTVTILWSDDWLSLGCGHPIQWIDVAPIRLLSLNVLQSLFESPLGDRIVDRCICFGYTGPISSCLVSFRASCTPIDAENNTPHLVPTTGGLQVAAYPLQSIVPRSTAVMMEC